VSKATFTVKLNHEELELRLSTMASTGENMGDESKGNKTSSGFGESNMCSKN
jgi:hypothetical protein